MTDTENNKIKLVKALRTSPIVQLACKKTNIARSTYYKWRVRDSIFARACDRAIKNGEALINDIIESKLVSLAQNNNLTAMIFWLKHNHSKYAVTSRDINVFNLGSSLPSTEEMVRHKNFLAADIGSSIAIRNKSSDDTTTTKRELELRLIDKDDTFLEDIEEQYEKDE